MMTTSGSSFITHAFAPLWSAGTATALRANSRPVKGLGLICVAIRRPSVR